MTEEQVIAGLWAFTDMGVIPKAKAVIYERNYKIRKRFEELTRQGLSAVSSIEQIADEFYLSYYATRNLIYKKRELNGEEIKKIA
jgi:hypothetical protein